MRRRMPPPVPPASRRRRTVSALLVAAALIAMCLPFRGMAVTDSFTVVETEVLPMTRKYNFLKLSQNDYVPHFALAEAGIGLNTVYTPAQQYFSLSWGGKTITFEVNSKVAFDSEKQYSANCTLVDIDGDQLFLLPVTFICDYFGWNSNVTPTAYGDMLRITTRSTSMNDKNFLIWFEDVVRQRYLEANPTAAPSPSPSGPGPISPAVPSQTFQSPSPSQVQLPTTVFLTVEGGPNELTKAFLDALDARGMPAAFFMRGDRMADYPEEMRRIAASVHTVGLGGYDDLADFYASPARMLDILDAGNDALDACTLTKTMLVRLPGGSEALSDELRRALVSAGYRYWDWTADATGGADAQAVYAQVRSALNPLLSKSEAERCVLRLRQDAATLEAMEKILQYLSGPGFTVQPLRETLRPINFKEDQCTLDSLYAPRVTGQ